MHKGFAVMLAVWAGAAPAAHGQLLLNGTFDDLPVGTAPNCGEPAGAWQFVGPGACENDPLEFQVVATDSFEPGASGNSLLQRVDARQTNPIYLRNMLTTSVGARPGWVVVVEFDLWVAEAGIGGGNVWIGEGESARAVQLGWYGNGHLAAATPAPGGSCPETLVASYPVGAWQHLRIVVNLNTQRYDVWWSLRGGTPQQIGSQRQFWSSSQCAPQPCFVGQISRVVFARFADGAACTETLGPSHSYLDNVSVYEAPVECYANCDGSTGSPALNVNDFICFQGRFAAGEPYADCDASGALNVNDFVCFQGRFAAGCP